MEAGGEPGSLRRDLEQIKQMLGSAVPKIHFWISGMEMELALKHGWNLIRAGEWTDALKVADETLSQTGNEVSLLMRGCALNGLSRYAEAEESLRKFTPTGTEADQYVPVELARAVMHQQRHDEAEQILLESLSQASARSYVELALTQHVTLLREVLTKRGDEEKARSTVEILKGLMPEAPALAVLSQ
jgi:tetratricopeptide (TPR) repeat protein